MTKYPPVQPQENYYRDGNGELQVVPVSDKVGKTSNEEQTKAPEELDDYSSRGPFGGTNEFHNWKDNVSSPGLLFVQTRSIQSKSNKMLFL